MHTFRILMTVLGLGLVMAGCASSAAMWGPESSCAEAGGCLNDWYQYQMISVDPNTGRVVTGPTPVQPTPQPKSVEGTQGAPVK